MGALKIFLKPFRGPVLGLFGPNTGLLLKKWGVTDVRLSQGNTGQPTLKKKFGTSHAKTIKNGFDMESRINYVSFYEKKNPKKHLRNIFKITLNFLTRPVLPHITVQCFDFYPGYPV